jgi:hypothetical protein
MTFFGWPFKYGVRVLQDYFIPYDSMSGFDYFLKYAGTLFKVMFHLQYHIDFLHLDS